jgi:hypothetical protein
MTKKSITEEELKALLDKMEINSMCHFMEVMTAAFPPKFKAQHNQIIAVSDIEGDFSANTFQKFMHMSEDRYECLGSSHLQGDTTYHWQFARALTEEDLGGAEVSGANLVPNDQSGLELESPAVPKPVDLRLKVGVLEARLDKLEKAPSEKFATKERLTRLISIIRDLEVADNDSDSNALLSHDDRDRLDNLYTEILP